MADEQKALNTNGAVVNNNNNQTDKENNTNNHSGSNNTHDEKQSGIHSSHRIETKKKIIFGAVFFISIIIIVGVMAANMLVTRTIESKVATADSAMADSAYQSSLLSNGLAIIAIAISVWAGLNIANSIERRELDEHNEKLKLNDESIQKTKQLIEDIRRITNDTKNEIELSSDAFVQTKKGMEEANDIIDSLSNEIKVINKKNTHLTEQQQSLTDLTQKLNQQISPLSRNIDIISDTLEYTFLNELLKTSNDLSSMWFYNRFLFIILDKTTKNEIDDYFSILITIERIFVEVYSNHTSAQKDNNPMIELAEKGLQIIENNTTPQLPALVKIYFKYRKAEFNFYSGYNTIDKNKIYNFFKTAITLYFELEYDFKITIPSYPKDVDNFIDLQNKDNRKIYMYFLNSIGESYSKIIHNISFEDSVIKSDGFALTKEDLIDMGNKAQFYFSHCIYCIEPQENYEVYYRNYGCLCERLDKLRKTPFSNNKTIIYCYTKAFELTINNMVAPYRAKSVYHTLIQYLYSYINWKMDGQKTFNQVINKRQNTTIRISKELLENIKTLYMVLQLAQNELPRIRLHYSVDGLLQTLFIVCFISKYNGFNDIYNLSPEKCLQKAKKDYIVLTIMNSHDDYYIELEKRIQSLEKYFEEGKK